MLNYRCDFTETNRTLYKVAETVTSETSICYMSKYSRGNPKKIQGWAAEKEKLSKLIKEVVKENVKGGPGKNKKQWVNMQ